MPRRFPPPWTVKRIEGGYKVLGGPATPRLGWAFWQMRSVAYDGYFVRGLSVTINGG